MQLQEYDLAVIGGGAGGLFAASVANALGAKTCIIEKKKLGGDCTWYGCMPSKAILKSAQVAHCFKRAQDYGIKISSGLLLNTQGVMGHVRDVVKEISAHHEAEDVEKRGIKVLFGSPRFLSSNQLWVGDSHIKAKKWIISTGSHPVVPPIEGLKEIPYLTNENVFDLERLPESLIVLGGGPIGCELSQALSRLGVKVTIVEMVERILIREDRELSKYVAEQLKCDGVQLVTGKKAVKFNKDNNRVSVIVEDQNKGQEKIIAENVLVAVGRAPNVDGLDLNKANVEYSSQGIKVNEYLQTTNPRIFACGDIASPYQFSHVAAYQAGVCVRNALFKRIAWQKVDYSNMTWATFTDPELAHLGLTESEAAEKSSKIKIYTTPYTNSDRATTDVEKAGLLKVITDEKGLILGAHIVGANAAEIIQGFLIAKSQRIPLSKLAQTMFIYPTLSELVKKTAAKRLVERGNQPLVKWLLKVLRAQKQSRPWIKLAVISAGLIIIFLILRLSGIDFSGITVESFKEKINSFGIWGPVVYVVFYLIRPLILFPAGVLSASAGVIWGSGKGLLIVLIAAYISATAEFLIARYFARDAVERLVKGKMEGIDRAIEKRGFLTVLLIRLIPNVAWDIQNLGLGVTKVRFRDYFFATLAGIIPGSFAFVYLGASFISVVTDPKHFWKIILAVLVFGLIYFMQNRLRRKKEEAIRKTAEQS